MSPVKRLKFSPKIDWTLALYSAAAFRMVIALS
jgi:hypothetical protein